MFEQIEQSAFQRVTATMGLVLRFLLVAVIQTALNLLLLTLVFGNALVVWNFVLAPAMGGVSVPLTWAFNGALVMCGVDWVIGFWKALNDWTW